jgi:hypothetical protein
VALHETKISQTPKLANIRLKDFMATAVKANENINRI